MASSGFTLIEAALATIIIGVGIMASMQLFAACTQQTAAATRATTAMFLANNVREAMTGMPFTDPSGGNPPIGADAGETTVQLFDDIDDFDLSSFSPPIDSFRNTIDELGQYTQVVSVMPVQPFQPSSNTDNALPKALYTGMVRVQVQILYRATQDSPVDEVYRTTWFRTESTETATPLPVGGG